MTNYRAWRRTRPLSKMSLSEILDLKSFFPESWRNSELSRRLRRLPSLRLRPLLLKLPMQLQVSLISMMKILRMKLTKQKAILKNMTVKMDLSPRTVDWF